MHLFSTYYQVNHQCNQFLGIHVAGEGLENMFGKRAVINYDRGAVQMRGCGQCSRFGWKKVISSGTVEKTCPKPIFFRFFPLFAVQNPGVFSGLLRQQRGQQGYFLRLSGKNLSKTYFFQDVFFQFLPWFFPPPGKNLRTLKRIQWILTLLS